MIKWAYITFPEFKLPGAINALMIVSIPVYKINKIVHHIVVLDTTTRWCQIKEFKSWM